MKVFEILKRRAIKWDRKFHISKRQQFVTITFILSFGLMLTQLVPVELRYPMTGVISVVAFLLSAFAMRENLHGISWFTLLTLPTLFTAAIALFYFLLPVRWLTRVPFVLLYAIGMYALLLTENIYHVASGRTIALLRAAHSVGFILTLVTYFLLIQTLFAFRFPFYINTVLTGLISFSLVFQSLWAMVLEDYGIARLWHLSIAICVVLSELAWVFSFWPNQSTLKVLLLVTSFYGTVGMGQQYVDEKLYKKNVIEFFILCLIIFCVVLMGTHWRGNY